MNKYYAGIGSRRSPAETLKFMTRIARILKGKGYTLRSGGADGADTAFAKGAGADKEVLRPHHATPEAIKIAMEVHPNPDACKQYVKKLHGRNVQIILGKDLDKPVEFVICYTTNEKAGGTSLGIRLAKIKNIPVYNLANQETLIKISNFLIQPHNKFW